MGYETRVLGNKKWAHHKAFRVAISVRLNAGMVIHGVTHHRELFWGAFRDAVCQIYVVSQILFQVNIRGKHMMC